MHHNKVDGHDVPVPHFGVVLEWQAWQALAERLRKAGTRFEIDPGIRFAGEVGEQATMFLYDPSGNALEFKAFEILRGCLRSRWCGLAVRVQCEHHEIGHDALAHVAGLAESQSFEIRLVLQIHAWQVTAQSSSVCQRVPM